MFLLYIYFFKDFFCSSFKFPGEFPYTPCPHTCIASPIINVLQKTSTFATNNEPTMTHHHRSKPTVHSMALYKHIMACIHHFYHTLMNLHCLKILCALSLSIPLLPTPTPGNHWSFYCLHSFPEWHTVRIIQHVVSSDCLLSLSNMPLRCPYVSLWLHCSFDYIFIIKFFM